MTGIYWGPFEALTTDATLNVEEVEPFHGLSAELYDQMSVADWDEAEYLALAARYAGSVLELGCGTGRILLRLAEAGHHVVGLDRSDAMLDILRARLGALPQSTRSRVSVVREDARVFSLDQRFDLILLPYLTLGLISEADDRNAVIRRVVEHLAGSGLFVFDYLTEFDENATSSSNEVIARDFWLRGRKVPGTFGARFVADERALVVNACWKIDCGSDGTRHCLESKLMRVFDNAEIARMLDEAGLVITHRETEDFGDGAARRTVIHCRKRSDRIYPLWHPYMAGSELEKAQLLLVNGSGCEVVDSEGRGYIDASGGLWSVQCGLGRAEIIDAVTKQLQCLSSGTLFMGRANKPALELSRRLVAMAPAPLEWVYLTGSGSESVELAIKLARSFFAARGKTEKKGVLYLDTAYHGTFFGSIGLSGLVPEKAVFSPMLPGLGAVPAPQPDAVDFEADALRCAAVFEAMLDQAGQHVAAFIIEPVLGSAGVIIPPRAYFERIQRACRNHEVLLIVDEVATGFGRTGQWFASEHFGLRPDIMLLGKGINSGYLPLGAALFSAEIGAVLAVTDTGIVHGSTHNGNAACCAAALATIDLMQRERLIDRARELGELFLARLQTLSGTPGLGLVRGLGLMLFAGLRDESGATANLAQVMAVSAAMQTQGVLVYPAPGGVIFCPALIVSLEQIERIVSSLVVVLRDNRLVDGGLQPRQPSSAWQ
jgi:adenosylmethionine-8-amino-7-oxononanoate aminotransferase